MTIHTEIRPAKGSIKRDRKAAEAAIQAQDFTSVMGRAMAAAKAYQGAWADRHAVHDEREAITPWSEFAAAEHAAQDAVPVPDLLMVDGGPWVGKAGAVVAMVRRKLDGTEERVDLGEEHRKTQLRTRDDIVAHCAGDPGLAQPMLAALSGYHAARRAAGRGVFNSMPPQWRELSRRYDRCSKVAERLQDRMIHEVYAALKCPAADVDQHRQKLELINIAFPGEMPTALYRPDRARRSFEPEEILAVTLGAIVRDLPISVTPRSASPLVDLIATWRNQELAVCEAEDKRKFDDPQTPEAVEIGKAWGETTSAILDYQPNSAEELAQLVTFFAEDTEDGRHDTLYRGERALAHLRRLASRFVPEAPLAVPVAWAHVVAARPNDLELARVVRFAIAEGHKSEELSQVVYESPRLPGWAPALYFEKPNGDEIIVTRHGVQTMLARHRSAPAGQASAQPVAAE